MTLGAHCPGEIRPSRERLAASRIGSGKSDCTPRFHGCGLEFPERKPEAPNRPDAYFARVTRSRWHAPYVSDDFAHIGVVEHAKHTRRHQDHTPAVRTNAMPYYSLQLDVGVLADRNSEVRRYDARKQRVVE